MSKVTDTLHMRQNRLACAEQALLQSRVIGGNKNHNSLFTHVSPALQRQATPCAPLGALHGR